MSLVNYRGAAKAVGQEQLEPQDVTAMKSMLEDPSVSHDLKNKILYGLSTAGVLSESEISQYANQIGGISVADCLYGGQAPMENITNMMAAYDKVQQQRENRAQQDVKNSQNALQQGGFSNSDQIIDQGVKGLKLFENFHPHYERAAGAGASAGGVDPAQSGPSTPLANGSAPAGGGATYSHSGVDPRSLHAGMDEFRGIDFTAFEADAQTLKEAHGAAEQSTEQLQKAWSGNTSEWTGQAKSVAQQRQNNLSEGAGTLSQALKTAPENITTVIRDGVEANVTRFANQVLDLYGDGTITGHTPPEIGALLDAKEKLPGVIEDLEAKIREIENRGPLESVGNFLFSAFLVAVTGGIALGPIVGIAFAENITEDNIKEETEKRKAALKEAKGKLHRFCVEYRTKANKVHQYGREGVKVIQKNYTSLIDALTKQLDPPPFAMSQEGGGKQPGGGPGTGGGGPIGGGGPTGSGGPTGGGGPVGGGPGAGGGPPGGAGATNPAGGGAQTPPTSPSSGGEEQPEMNPVTGKPLETNPETGEAYPIDPETGEAIKDAGEEQETLTVAQGDNEITMSEPDDGGQMKLAFDDGTGKPLDFKLDFQPGGEGEAGKGDEAEGGQGQNANGEMRQDFGPSGSGESGQGETAQKVYTPGPDGKIHIEQGGLDITAEQPKGPDGPTLVTVDDGSGEPTTYTLGEQESGHSGTDSGPGDASTLRAMGGSGAEPGDDVTGSDSSSDAAQEAGFDGELPGVVDGQDAAQEVPESGEGMNEEAVPGGGGEGAPAPEDQSSTPEPASAAQDAEAAPDTAENVTDMPEPGNESAQDAAPGDSEATSAQGMFGDVFGGDSGVGAGVDAMASDSTPLDAGMETGSAAPESGSAGLGTAPGGNPTPDDAAEPSNSGSSMGGMGAMGAGAGAGAGGGDQERGSSGYTIFGDLFGGNDDEGSDSNRISGSLDDDEPANNYAGTGQ